MVRQPYCANQHYGLSRKQRKADKPIISISKGFSFFKDHNGRKRKYRVSTGHGVFKSEYPTQKRRYRFQEYNWKFFGFDIDEKYMEY